MDYVGGARSHIADPFPLHLWPDVTVGQVWKEQSWVGLLRFLAAAVGQVKI